MSQCNFSIPISGNAEEIFNKAQTAITGAGGQFTGDVGAGEFSLSTFIGAIKGSYSMKASTMNVIITDKPMFLSCSQIEKELSKYLGL